MMRRLDWRSIPLLWLAACGSASSDAGNTGDSDGDSESASGEESGTQTGTSAEGTDGTGNDDGPRLDVGPDDEETGTDESGDTGMGACKVEEENMDAVPECSDQAPPDSFEQALQWSWDGDGSWGQSMTMALVANLTDDNEDGEIDLCDTPDVVLTVYDDYDTPLKPAWIYVLDGEDGTMHFRSQSQVWSLGSPALGDIDDDGVPEIVAVSLDDHKLVAFDSDGSQMWKSTVPVPFSGGNTVAIAIGDVDNDGDPEIAAGHDLWAHDGTHLQTFADTALGFANATALADLDDDGDLEIVVGRSAFHHDGTEVFNHQQIQRGLPTIADLDDDPEPEILLHSGDGFSLIDHDGNVQIAGDKPLPPGPKDTVWIRPSAVHDFDSNGDPEFAVSVAGEYALFEPDFTNVWLAAVSDESGAAGGTAFDFLGDGGAEAMYADEENLFIFDDLGGVLLSAERSSRTIIEYPVVADVDNDGSAEIIVTSAKGFDGMQSAPAVQVFGDAQDRWVQARRIWNQHTYHVTNVREDGVIPTEEAHHWEHLNTFRTQAQIEEGGTCKPPPEG